MAFTPWRSLHSLPTAGFSLIELSVVVAILSVVATLGLEVAAGFVNRSMNTLSRERLQQVDEAIAGFFRVYGRLPCPADKTLSPVAASNYGLENCALAVLTGTTVGGGLMAGAVPFRSLNLPMQSSLDAFGGKLHYVVSKNLTVAGSDAAGKFGYRLGTSAQNGIGGIEMRSGALEQPCSTTKCQILANPASNLGAAYILFSAGADQRGAVSARGVALKPCNVYASERRVDTQNCVFGDNTVRAGMIFSSIPYNVFYDNRLNAGLNLASYFDDIVVWRARSQL